MNPYKKLMNNSIIFAIGNLGSKVISLLLVPLYTYHLTTAEFGTVDIIVTTTRLLMPIISLSIFDAVLRFIMDKTYDNSDVITLSVKATILGSAVLLTLLPILEMLNVFSGYLVYMYMVLVAQSFESIFSQYARAIGKLKIFATNGILMSLVLAISNVFFLVYIKAGIEGYLFSIVVSNIISILYLLKSLKIKFSFKTIGFKSALFKEMLNYSIPLIPNALMWWTMSASNRYILLYSIGASANGLFAVAQKIPTLLSVVSSIFAQSWQLSAIEEYESKERSHFYSKVFKNYSILMFISVSVILVVIKLLLKVSLAEEYFIAWEVVPFLLFGSMFNSFSVFLGSNYIAAKETKGVFKTTIYGTFVTIIIGAVLIPLLGVKGAGISIMMSSMVMWIVRMYDTKKYIEMTLEINIIIKNISILIIQSSLLYLNLSSLMELVIGFIFFILMLVVNRSFFTSIIHLFLGNKN